MPNNKWSLASPADFDELDAIANTSQVAVGLLHITLPALTSDINFAV
jgi:hypothetical protein